MHKELLADSANRRSFIGGSDARTIMGDDEPALPRLWREKRGEVESEDLSGNLLVQLGLVTEPLNRHWYKLNAGRPALRPDHFSAHKRLFVGFGFKRSPETHSGSSPVLVDKLHAGSLQSRANLGCCLVPTAQAAVLSLQPLYRRNRYVGCNRQSFLRPSQQCARSLNLPG
jgi:hypothetical protein